MVTQPGFISDRGDDYRREVEAAEQPWLYPCATLIRAGVAVAGSTDAPFGPADPWRCIAAAVHRRTPGGRVLGRPERISAGRALRLFLGAAGSTPAGPAPSRRASPRTCACCGRRCARCWPARRRTASGPPSSAGRSSRPPRNSRLTSGRAPHQPPHLRPARNSHLISGQPATATLTTAASPPRTGFETALAVPSAGPYFAAEPHDAGGKARGRSPVVKAA